MTQTNDCACKEIIEVSTRLTRAEADVMSLRSDLNRMQDAFNALLTRFALLDQRVAIYAGAGGLIGGVATAIAVTAIQKFIFGG